MAWSPAHAKLHILLRARILLPKHSRILMAVSGGQDSLCLAYLLVELATKWQWSLGIVHCDHQWREDSAENAAHVLAMANRWQVPAWIKVASRPPASEAAARQWRYDVFGSTARQQNYHYVVTGHTQSDRAETVLYNLTRGTGTDGIGTLPWVRSLDAHQPSVTLVRPLLQFNRQETADLCRQQQIPIWEDSTNQDLRFRRNRIRQELLPYLQEHFNPQVEKALAQLAEIATAETAYLNEQATALYVKCIVPAANDKRWEIQRELLSQAPVALQRRVIQQLLRQAMSHSTDNSQPSNLHQPNFLQIEKLIELLTAPNGSQSDPYPGGWIAKVTGPIVSLSQRNSVNQP